MLSSNKKINSNDGFDCRYNMTTDLNLEQLKKIKVNLEKKKILDILQDNSTNINTKLNIIKDNDIIKNFKNNISNNDYYYYEFDK